MCDTYRLVGLNQADSVFVKRCAEKFDQRTKGTLAEDGRTTRLDAKAGRAGGKRWRPGSGCWRLACDG